MKSVRHFDRANKDFLTRNREYLRGECYLETVLEHAESEYSVQKTIADSLYERLKYFVGEHEVNLYDPLVQRTANRILRIINIHLDRVDNYLRESNKKAITGTDEEKSRKLLFDNKLYREVNKLRSDIDDLKINEGKKAEGITFFENVACPLLLHEQIIKIYPEIQASLDEMGIDFDSTPPNKMLIQIPEEERPYWDPRLHYWEQTPKAIQFYVDEFKKIRNGIMMGDVYIEPWLYTHLNVCVFSIPTPTKNIHTGAIESVDKAINPPLRDNEWWIIQDNYQKAKETNKHMFICATRRAAKTTVKASLAIMTILQGKRRVVVAGSSDPDLTELTTTIEFCIDNLHPAFNIPLRGRTNWEKEVDIVIKSTSRKNIGNQVVHIRNTRSGAKNSDQVLAGGAMDALLYDEVMKSRFITQFNAAKPALSSGHALRTNAVLSGCLCAGTKVHDGSGRIVNIEDLKQEDGILGYDSTGVISEKINWFKEPSIKDCVEIIMADGTLIRCSTDHPFLQQAGHSSFAKPILAKNIKTGHKLLSADKILTKGSNQTDKYIFKYDRQLKKGKYLTGKTLENLTPKKVVSIKYIGKQMVYNLNTSITNSYLAEGLVTFNTGGNEELSKDALIVLRNLDHYDLYEMDWELFESRIPNVDEVRTWRKDKFATFVPGQMSHKPGMKKYPIPLYKYLGVLKEDFKGFEDLEIQVTDWEYNNSIFEKEDELLKNNKTELIANRISFPRCPSYIFLSGQESPFPNEEIQVFLSDEDKHHPHEKIILSKDVSGNFNVNKSDKVVPEFPFEGGNIDGPITIFERPVPNPPPDFYVAGLDDYNQETSNTDSVGSIVILRRDTKRVVATIHTRPKPHTIFHKQMVDLLDYYNAKVFMENADMDFMTYLNSIDTTYSDKYLYRSVNFLTDMEQEGWDRVSTREFGWAPTAKNKRTLFGLLVKEANTVYRGTTEEGEPRVYMGYENFRDTRLLTEAVNWKPGGNYDGLTALMSALGIDYYLTFSGVNFTGVEEAVKPEPKTIYKQPAHTNVFGGGTSIHFSNSGKKIKSNF